MKRVHYFPLLVFLDKGLKFQSNVCNDCHDIFIVSMNLKDIAILKICGVHYQSIVNRIIKIEAMVLSKNANLNKKSRYYEK